MDFGSVSIESYDKFTFGKCIRQQREEMGLSLRTVASNIGISAAYLSDIEKGNRYAPISNNNLDTFNKLLTVLQIPEEQAKYVKDMAYSTHGCHKDIVNYLSECEKARLFMRYACESELADDDWDDLLKQLDEKGKRKSLTRFANNEINKSKM